MLSGREERERQYYNQYVKLHPPPKDLDFGPVMGVERRPWNSYWFLYELAGRLKGEKRRLLDFGCGAGEKQRSAGEVRV